MNILYFSPAPTKDNPSMCPFIAQRIYALQNQGHSVTVLQYGNLTIQNPLKTRKKGFLKPVALLYKSAKFLLHSVRFANKKKTFSSALGSFCYYDSLTFTSYASFYKWYRKNQFDLIHGHFLWFANQLPVLKKQFGIPYVVTVHGSDMHELTPYDTEKVEQAKIGRV